TEADIVFINGADLESGFESAIVDNLRDGATLVRYADLFEGSNPHFWLSVDNAVVYVQEIARTLAASDPADKTLYQANLIAYQAELSDLSRELEDAVASIPPERRKLVTTHDAFPFFAEYLGLELVGFVTPTEGQEPSPGDIRELVNAIRNEKVTAVFAEPGFTDRTLRQIAADTGVDVCTLYGDALDKKVTSYLEMMRFNAGELARCLGGGAGG
ncbi:MAG: zinc ABC transporter substrate-binding protein, partial [Chloroflexi bacterium]|nr:zinc ABC transporter substrate-binding protein [Chloroflexota bacterium]